MQVVQTKELERMSFSQTIDPENVVSATWPVHRETGAASTATVAFDLAPGMRLPRHTDSAEEVLVLLEGEVEVTVGNERGRMTPGTVAVVPAMTPHEVRNVGNGTARVLGVFPSNTIVSVFDEEFAQTGGRVVGSPPPSEAMTTGAR